MTFLVLNCGSSSVKFKLFKEEKVIIEGNCEEIGSDRSKIKYYIDKEEEKSKKIISHKEAIIEIIEIIKTKSSIKEVKAIIHRVVHGGEYFKETTIINNKVLEKIKEISELAPLHNPVNIIGIEVMKELFPKTKQVAVFDTAFHSTIPKKAFLYGIPYKYYKEKKIRRYGFHGTSHRYVSKEAIRILGKEKSKKIISCHLGNGSSICAINEGKSIDNSMGFTPLEGVIMGTRSGSIDPSIVLRLIEQYNLSVEELKNILNKKSGLLGLSEISSDMRLLLEKKNKEEGANRAIEVMIHSVVKKIGSYAAVLNGVEAIVFTGGIGEKARYIREKICENFKYLGLEIDKKRNNSNEQIISSKNSKVSILVIPTNEELEMVREAKKLLIS